MSFKLVSFFTFI